MKIPSTRPVIAESLASPSAAARRLDRDDVAGGDVTGQLRGGGLAVDEVAAGGAGCSTPLAPRCVHAALADDREAAVLEHAQLAHDAVATAVRAAAAGAEPQPVALDPERVLQLER